MYKVVKKNLKSCSNTDYPVQYKIGEWVYPSLEGSKLFVFDTLENVSKFLFRRNCNFLVFECEIQGEPEEAKLFSYSRCGVEYFWNCKNQNKPYYPQLFDTYVPVGTYYVDAIKLVKEIKMNVTITDVENKVDEFLYQDKQFSAYDVTVALRDDGFWAPHNDVRSYVHDYMRNSSSYGSNNNGQYIEYFPLNVQKSNKLTPKESYQTRVASRNRVTVLSHVIKKWGLNPGDKVRHTGDIVCKLSSKIDDTNSKLYTVDSYYEVRVPVDTNKSSVQVDVYDDYLTIT